jgi:hypothetical protein
VGVSGSVTIHLYLAPRLQIYLYAHAQGQPYFVNIKIIVNIPHFTLKFVFYHEGG